MSEILNSDEAPFEGKRIGDFTIAYRISSGMNTDVFAVWHHKMLAPLVCKRLKRASANNPKYRELFFQEAEALAAMNHPGIVRLFEFNEREELPYLLLEHIGERTLRDEVRENGAFDAPRAVRIVQHVAAAVSHIHSKGFLHRDLKPSNIILRAGRPVLIDFGVVWKIEPKRTPPDRSGTPQYLAPEQIKQEKLSFATDVYGLGMLLFELLKGERPFKRGFESSETESLAERYPQLVENPKRFEENGQNVNVALAKIVYRCLEKCPEARFANAVELIRELDSFTDIKIWSTGGSGADPFQ
ncbi:MAG: serine/threonine protein kinase [Acidobacteriota bacterium]|nr:serine/threonine protein kinase [Acidobacteriota bacterium]